MALFFFDTNDGEDRRIDEDGTEFPSKDDARRAAISLLPSIACEEFPDANERLFEVNVRDEAGIYLFRASLVLKSGWL